MLLSRRSSIKSRGVVFGVVVVCAFSSVVFGQPWDGNGIEGDPYQIWTAADMQAIGGNSNYWDAHFLLCADIDLSAYTGTSFNIVGTDSSNRFAGVFDGNEHIISNFTYSSAGMSYIGLFGYIDDPNAEIRDLGLVSADVNGGTGNNIGSVAGELRDGAILRCYANGSVSGNENVGGLVGNVQFRKYDNPEIHNSYSNCAVSGMDAVGGLCGSVSGRIRPKIFNSYSSGSVTGTGQTGGLVGYGEGEIVYCYWDIETSGQASSAAGLGRTTAQMRSKSTFAGWGACGNEGTWVIDDGNDYPRLGWENKPGEVLRSELSDLVTGSGEPNNPYLIYTAEQLSLIGAFMCEWDGHFNLMADIDLSDFNGLGGNRAFNTIGNLTTKFTGVFDGDGHTVFKLRYDSSGSDYAGMFGYIAGPNSLVRDLGLVEPNVEGGAARYIGCLVGRLEDGTITACYAQSGSARGGWQVGGLVGSSSGEISNCHVDCTIESTAGVSGGLAGGNSGVVSMCSATGSVASSPIRDGKVGGLIGTNGGEVYECWAGCSVSGYASIGGLVGWNSVKIYHSYSTGSVSGAGMSVGGLVGANGVGGAVVGSYAAGPVDGTGVLGGGLAGGNSGWIWKCYWDMDVTGEISSVGGEGRTTAEMQDANTFLDAGWDFVDEVDNGYQDIWRLCNAGAEYPQLNWQYPLGDFGCPDGVDSIDLGVLCEEWLLGELLWDVRPEGGDGIVNFLDWAIFADGWGDTYDIFDLADFAGEWLGRGVRVADIAPYGGDGIVNVLDYAVLADNWLGGV